MKQVTRYESDDGQVFDTEEACKRHEQRQQVIKKIDAELYLRDCSAEDVFDFVVNNIHLFCVPAGMVSSVYRGELATTLNVWSHTSNVAVHEGTKLLVNVFEKSVPVMPQPIIEEINGDELARALKHLSNVKGVDAVKKLYKEFGVNSFTEVESHQYYQMFNAVGEELKKPIPATPLPTFPSQKPSSRQFGN